MFYHFRLDYQPLFEKGAGLKIKTTFSIYRSLQLEKLNHGVCPVFSRCKFKYGRLHIHIVGYLYHYMNDSLKKGTIRTIS